MAKLGDLMTNVKDRDAHSRANMEVTLARLTLARLTGARLTGAA